MHAAPRSYASIENISPLLQRLHGVRIHLICASTLAHTQKTVALPFWPLCEFSLTKTPQWQVFWQEVESTFAFGCSHLFGSLARLPKRGGAYGWKWSGLFNCNELSFKLLISWTSFPNSIHFVQTQRDVYDQMRHFFGFDRLCLTSRDLYGILVSVGSGLSVYLSHKGSHFWARR